MIDLNQQERMKELIYTLNEAARKYYSSKEESHLTDKEYDAKLEELAQLEKILNVIFPSSPTQRVGYSTPNDKIPHETPILSLQSSKDPNDILKWIGDQEALLTWKIDGVSIVLYYDQGKLQQAVSRGDGVLGKDITKNVILMKNVPLVIPNKCKVTIRGEGCITLKDFDNLKKTKEGERYMNPRNLASGLINSTRVTPILLRQMNFLAHTITRYDEKFLDAVTRMEQMIYLQQIGFKLVEWDLVNATNVVDAIKEWSNQEELDKHPYPVDGLVLTINDLLFAEEMGRTDRFPKHSYAFKWPDEVKETYVTGMLWSVSQTGLITPIVQFKPVLIDGTMVKQANLHSLKIFKRHRIGIGDKVTVYKANKIIPHIERNLTCSNTETYPKNCPVCNEPTVIFESDKTEKLLCNRCGGK